MPTNAQVKATIKERMKELEEGPVLEFNQLRSALDIMEGTVPVVEVKTSQEPETVKPARSPKRVSTKKTPSSANRAQRIPYATRREEILRMAPEESRPLTSPRVAERFGIAPTSAASVLSRMAEEGLFTITEPSSANEPKMYSPTATALDEAQRLQQTAERTAS